MRTPKLPHVKTVKASGKAYAYFNTGQVKANGNPIYARLPAPSSVGFWDSYAALVAGRTKRASKFYTVADLADEYQASDKFRKLSDGTQRIYGLTLDKIRRLLGEFVATDLEQEDIRLVLDGEKMGPGAHNIFTAVIGCIYQWGRARAKVKSDPAGDIEKMETGAHEAWPEPLLDAGLESDHARTRLAIHLLFYTGQRIGDVCKMRWGDIRDGVLYVTQQKTGKELEVPVHRDLADELALTPKRGMTIIVSEAGQQMTPQVIRRELKAFGALHGAEVVPHGLRKNAVHALLLAGCSVPQAAAITGQTHQVVEYYAKRIDQGKLAHAAILLFENKPRRGKTPGKNNDTASISAGPV